MLAPTPPRPNKFKVVVAPAEVSVLLIGIGDNVGDYGSYSGL